MQNYLFYQYTILKIVKAVNLLPVANELNNEIEEIENKIKQEFAYNTTISELEEQGFSIDEEARDNGEIRIRLTRVV